MNSSFTRGAHRVAGPPDHSWGRLYLPASRFGNTSNGSVPLPQSEPESKPIVPAPAKSLEAVVESNLETTVEITPKSQPQPQTQIQVQSTEPKVSEPVKKPAKGRSFSQRLANGVLLLAPITNLLGGVSLLSSAVMPVMVPDKKIAVIKRRDGEEAAIEVDEEVSPRPISGEEIKAVESTLEQLKRTLTDFGYKVFTPDNKSLLREMGWTFTSVGVLMTSINRLAAGYVSRQPGMVLCSLGMMCTAPLLLISPSVQVQAGLAFFLGPWLAGAANKVRNKFYLKPGEQPRELDMAPLIDRDALKKTIGEANPSRGKIIRAWISHFLKTCKFIGTDQVLLVKNTSKSILTGWQNRSELQKSAKKNVKESYDYLVGRQEETPALFKPSATQNQVASMLMYAGSVPILLLAGQEGAVVDVCTKLIAAGSFTANIPLLATGIHNKDAEMIVAIPLMTAGITQLNTDTGQALTRIGVAGYMNHLRKDVIKHPGAHQKDNPSEELPV